MTRFKLQALTAALFLSAMCGAADAAVVFLGKGAIPGTGSDLSGLTGTLEDGTSASQMGAFGSGIAYSGFGNRYVATPDRGPNATNYNPAVDNTTSYIERFQTIDVEVKAIGGGAYSVTPKLVATTLLSNEQGRFFTGLSTGFDATNSSNSQRLDPEGVRVSNDSKSLYVSDEYGPYVYQIDRASGKRTRVYNTCPPASISRNPRRPVRRRLPTIRREESPIAAWKVSRSRPTESSSSASCRAR